MGRLKAATIEPSDAEIMAMLEEMLSSRDTWEQVDALMALEAEEND